MLFALHDRSLGLNRAAKRTCAAFPDGIKEGQLIDGGKDQPLGTRVATFTHPDVFGDAGDFKAVVDWGDDPGAADQTATG